MYTLSRNVKVKDFFCFLIYWQWLPVEFIGREGVQVACRLPLRMGEGCYNRQRYCNEQAKYSEAAAEAGEEHPLEGGARNMRRELLLHAGFTAAFWSTLT